MILDALSNKYRDSILGLDLVCEYEAGIPIFKIRAKVDAIRRQEVPAVAQFVLRLLRMGIGDAESLAVALGIEEEFVRDALGYLDRNQLVERRFDASFDSRLTFVVSELGKRALEQALVALTTDRLYAQVNGLTGEIAPLEVEFLFEGSVLRKEGVWLLNASSFARPTIESLNQGILLLQRILTSEAVESNQDREIVQVIEIERSWLMYKRVNILAFRNRNNERLSFRVFEGYEPNLTYDQVLTRRERKGGRVIPDGALVSLSEASQPSQRVLSLQQQIDIPRIELILQKIDELEARQSELTTDVKVEEDSTANNIKSVADRASEIERLAAEKEALRRQLPASRHIRSNEHRQVLRDALATAKERIFLISPWIKQDATDDQIINLIKGAVQRGVWIAIGYGMPLRSKETKQDFIDQKVKDAFDRIRKQPNGNMLHLEWLGNTHEKILVCDARYHVITSFNWLSYRGDQGFRQERGFYSEDPGLTADLCQDLCKSFKSLPNGFPGKPNGQEDKPTK